MDDIIIKNIQSFKMNGQLRTKEYMWLNEKKKLLPSNYIINMEEIMTIDIEIDFTDMECFKCRKKIPDDKELYYCYICKIKYCYECVQEKLKKNGKEKFIDKKHNL